MTVMQYEAFLAMLCGMRVALLGIVDAIEVMLIANGRIKERTSEIRRKLKSQTNCDMIVE